MDPSPRCLRAAQPFDVAVVLAEITHPRAKLSELQSELQQDLRRDALFVAHEAQKPVPCIDSSVPKLCRVFHNEALSGLRRRPQSLLASSRGRCVLLGWTRDSSAEPAIGHAHDLSRPVPESIKHFGPGSGKTYVFKNS